MKIHSISDWLESQFPFFYGYCRPLLSFPSRLLSRQSYWEKRKKYKYYKELIRLAKKHTPYGTHVIDVGAFETDVISQLNWFKNKVALDVRYIPSKKGIKTIYMDFMDYKSNTYYDLVLCLQVLEHLPALEAFANKLLNTGKTIIISVPYLWPKGYVKNHLQDPIDELKLQRWKIKSYRDLNFG